MYRLSANSRATISSTAIFFSQQSRQYRSSPRGSDTSFDPHRAHFVLTRFDFLGAIAPHYIRLGGANSQRPTPNAQPLPTPNCQPPTTPNDWIWDLGIGRGWQLRVGNWEFDALTRNWLATRGREIHVPHVILDHSPRGEDR